MSAWSGRIGGQRRGCRRDVGVISAAIGDLHQRQAQRHSGAAVDTHTSGCWAVGAWIREDPSVST